MISEYGHGGLNAPPSRGRTDPTGSHAPRRRPRGSRFARRGDAARTQGDDGQPGGRPRPVLLRRGGPAVLRQHGGRSRGRTLPAEEQGFAARGASQRTWRTPTSGRPLSPARRSVEPRSSAARDVARGGVAWPALRRARPTSSPAPRPRGRASPARRRRAVPTSRGGPRNERPPRVVPHAGPQVGPR